MINTGPNANTKVEGLEDFPADASDASRWKSELDLAEKEFTPYWERCDKITRRYRLEKDNGEAREDEALCLLWGQVQTEIPAIYQRKPQPEVSRRFDAKDPAARVASLIAERYLAVDIERQGIDGECEAMVRSYLLYDRAIAWVDIDPEIVTDEQTGEERVADLRAPAIYLMPRDFMHSASRNWREVTWVARRHFFTRDGARKKFAQGMQKYGWEIDDLPLDAEPTYASDAMKQAAGDVFKRCVVWEIWDHTSGQVIFVNRAMEKLVDLKPMPAKLESRFPAPEPCYGTITDGSLIPVPAFVQWQQLSDEIDELSTRIKYLTQAVRIAGTHDESVPELAKILTEGEENTLVGVKNWSALREQGGLPGSISLMPLTEIVNALQVLGEQRQQRIDLLNLLTGHTDVMRGQGDPRTTATQDRIKSNYGSLRLQEKQADFARFTQRMLRIKAEIIVELAPEDVLIAVSSAEDLPEVQKAREQQAQAQQAAMQAQMQPPQPGQPPQPPPAPQEDILVRAVALLKDDRLRDFRLDVVERSMAAIDEGEEKAEATEFATAMGSMLQNLAGAPPELLDVGGEAALFVARKHRVGRELESAFEHAIEGLKQKAEAARQAPPQPPPEVQAEELRAKNAEKELQLTAQNKQQEMSLKHTQEMERINLEAQRTQAMEQAQANADRAMQMFEMQMKERIAQNEAQWDAWLKEREMNFDMKLAERKAQLDERIAVMEAQQESQSLAIKTQHEAAKLDMKSESDRLKAERDTKPKNYKLRVSDSAGDMEEFHAEFVDDDEARLQ